MLKIADYYNAINDIAPFALAESWDNVGVIVGDKSDSADRVMLALDITESVIAEAVENSVNLIITHHPLMFSPIQKLSSSDLAFKLIANGIGMIAAHTNLDKAEFGVNFQLAKRIGLSDLEPLAVENKLPYYTVCVYAERSNAAEVYSAMTKAGAGSLGNYTGAGFMSEGIGQFVPVEGARPTIGKVGIPQKVEEIKLEMLVSSEKLNAVIRAMITAHSYEEPSYSIFLNEAVTKDYSLGLVGYLKTPMSSMEFAKHVKESLGASGVRYMDNQSEIYKVGLCGGSGGSYLNHAISKEVNAYLTGEIDHHFILEAQNFGVTLVEAGHFSTENVVIAPLKELLEQKLDNSDIIISTTATDGMLTI